MINAKQEFLDHVSERCVGGRTVRCAKVSIHLDRNVVSAILPIGYTPEAKKLFLQEIDLDYDESYGEQLLFGTIWYNDGITWSQRGEYDGKEWYEFQSCPNIPEELVKGT